MPTRSLASETCADAAGTTAGTAAGTAGAGGSGSSGSYSRTARRLAIFGTIATIPFIALGGLGWGWWPFNIMATLLVATLCAWLIEVGGPARLVVAAAVFIVGGALVLAGVLLASPRAQASAEH